MDSQEFRQAAADLTKYLRLKTDPLGFKLYENVKEAEKNGLRLPNQLAICQVVNTARFHGRALVATTEDSLCVIGAVALGLLETPVHMASGELFVKLGYITNYEKAEKYQRCFTRLEPTYKAFAVKPLERMKATPDVILIYGNSAQIALTLFAFSTETAERLQLSMFGESALCSGIAQAMTSGRPQISLPCFGERVFAGTADDEILLILPCTELTRLTSSLERLYRAGVRYPIPLAACATSIKIAEVLRPDYKP